MSTTRLRSESIRVEGLVELRRALDTLEGNLGGELRRASRTVAGFVATDARSAAYAVGGVAAHVAPSVKASAGYAFAGVALGGAGYEMAGGAEFGAGHDTPRTRKTGTYLGLNQFKPWRGNGADAGYFVYPSIRRDENRIVETYTGALDHLVKKAGL